MKTTALPPARVQACADANGDENHPLNVYVGMLLNRGEATPETRRATALLHAAPDLLDALQCTLALAEAYYRSLPDDGPEQDHYMTAVIEPARAAIAKAEGRE